MAVFAIARARLGGSAFAFAGVATLACHEVALIVDVYRGRTTEMNSSIAALYIVQFPLLPAGPLVRYQDIDRHWRKLDRAIGLGAFTYGMRRLITGLIKVRAVAGTLATPADAIFKLPASQLSPDAAWLAAVCFSLQLYFQLSGYADIAIGLGRMLGLRYPENFRRPYLADSMREFWRRWHVTSITWLRDYAGFPLAGRDAPTLHLLPNIVAGFVLLGFWYGGGWTVALWAAYSSAFLALEAVGFGPRLARWSAPLQHAYVLLVVIIGWVILRADSIVVAMTMLQTMAGIHGLARLTAAPYLTLQVWIALIVGVVGAGPLIPWISRWRVSLDAVTTALVMMATSVSLFLWRGGSLIWSVLSPSHRGRTRKT
jgi:alginate O-acetyltransferase complex protein AlgI